MQRKWLITFRLAVSLAALPVSVSAQVIASSSFTNGTDGWLLGGLYLPLWQDPNGLLFWNAIGGNPGGYIGTKGDARAPGVASVEGFLAPGSYLGNQSAAFGGVLSFFTRALLGVDGLNYPEVVISDGTTTLQYRVPPPGTGWMQYAIPFRSAPGWEIATGNANFVTPGPQPTDAQFKAVIGNLSFMSILTDWKGGEDLTDLDKVVLSATPEPSTFLLLASGLGALGGLTWRRRRRS